jgi:uncharacterized Fe-S cluster-containing radical SAM superfamily protein
MSGSAPRPALNGPGRDWAAELAPLGSRKLKVVWDISNKCNLRCRMCHFAFDDVFYRPAEYMRPEVFERLAEQALPNAHTLILSAGNEPLTSPWFADILRIAARYQVPDLLFITNATRLTPKIAEAILDSGVTQVQISIDGSTKETYENIRRGADFDKLIKNIRYLTDLRRKRGSLLPRLQFNIVLMKSNLEELDGFVDLAESLEVDWIAARHLLMMSGLGMESETLFDDPERANGFFERFLRRVEASTSVQTISFPDMFDVDAIRQAERDRRLVSHDAPFGFIDTPGPSSAAGTSVTFNGWALDSERLVGVTLEREAFADDPAAKLNERGRIHVADARLGVGRGDVARLYPDFSGSAAAGWTVDIRQQDLPATATETIRFHVMAFSLGHPPAEIGVRSVRFGASPDETRPKRRATLVGSTRKKSAKAERSVDA